MTCVAYNIIIIIFSKDGGIILLNSLRLVYIFRFTMDNQLYICVCLCVYVYEITLELEEVHRRILLYLFVLHKLGIF